MKNFLNFTTDLPHSTFVVRQLTPPARATSFSKWRTHTNTKPVLYSNYLARTQLVGNLVLLPPISIQYTCMGNAF